MQSCMKRSSTGHLTRLMMTDQGSRRPLRLKALSTVTFYGSMLVARSSAIEIVIYRFGHVPSKQKNYIFRNPISCSEK